MFTPLSTGSERAQDRIWERDRTASPRTKHRTRPSLTLIGTGVAGVRGLNVGRRPLSPFSSRFGPASDLSPQSPSLPGLHGAVPSHRNRRPRRISAGDDDRVQTWAEVLSRPSAKTVDGWLSSIWKRHFVLTLLPCIVVWIWVAMPFPVNDPYKDSPLPDLPRWPGRPKWIWALGTNGNADGEDDDDLPLDVNFYFFLLWYFGAYIAVAMMFITNLFSLYRLNWWPQRLGGKTTYLLFWAGTLCVGYIGHWFDLFNLHKRWREKDPKEDFDWERKTFWVLLSFASMLLPALACFSKLRRDKRHVYRHAQPVVQYTFFGQSLRRIPSSWLRFLWFMSCLGLASFALIAGQAYASLFLSTLPHTSVDAGIWVWSWVLTTQLLALISFYIINSKVRSRALLFLYKLFFQLVYFIFYRNLFARLRSPTQFATVQLLSSISVMILFPAQMTKVWHRGLQVVFGYPHSWQDHVENVAVSFYCRGLAQNVTMVGFLGWLSILHFGPNSQIYPFFKFSVTPDDPYTFSMTFWASCAVWASELVSSLAARLIMSCCFGIDVSQVGLDEMREYPDLVPACGWASVHVSMNILLFLIKLNFR